VGDGVMAGRAAARETSGRDRPPPPQEALVKRVATAAVLLVALVLGTTAAAGGVRGPASARPAPKAQQASPTPITTWVGWSARELGVFKKVIAEYDKANPNVKVNVVGGINDDKIVAAIRGGTAPDVVSSFNSYNVGSFCSSGAWMNLGPFLKEGHVNV